MKYIILVLLLALYIVSVVNIKKKFVEKYKVNSKIAYAPYKGIKEVETLIKVVQSIFFVLIATNIFLKNYFPKSFAILLYVIYLLVEGIIRTKYAENNEYKNYFKDSTLYTFVVGVIFSAAFYFVLYKM